MKKPLFNDDEEFYINDSGLFVFTAEFLLKRGYCCGNGCLHCPYDYKNVIDPIKKKRLQDEQRQRTNNSSSPEA
ncbi:MAG: hypothetical protein FGM54_09165 [Chitinophagaceae bacterium]|nr:hypothetical protein [Chitinophagaceae bacterium]